MKSLRCRSCSTCSTARISLRSLFPQRLNRLCDESPSSVVRNPDLASGDSGVAAQIKTNLRLSDGMDIHHVPDKHASRRQFPITTQRRLLLWLCENRNIARYRLPSVTIVSFCCVRQTCTKIPCTNHNDTPTPKQSFSMTETAH